MEIPPLHIGNGLNIASLYGTSEHLLGIGPKLQFVACPCRLRQLSEQPPRLGSQTLIFAATSSFPILPIQKKILVARFVILNDENPMQHPHGLAVPLLLKEFAGIGKHPPLRSLGGRKDRLAETRIRLLVFGQILRVCRSLQKLQAGKEHDQIETGPFHNTYSVPLKQSLSNPSVGEL